MSSHSWMRFIEKINEYSMKTLPEEGSKVTANFTSSNLPFWSLAVVPPLFIRGSPSSQLLRSSFPTFYPWSAPYMCNKPAEPHHNPTNPCSLAPQRLIPNVTLKEWPQVTSSPSTSLGRTTGHAHCHSSYVLFPSSFFSNPPSKWLHSAHLRSSDCKCTVQRLLTAHSLQDYSSTLRKEEQHFCTCLRFFSSFIFLLAGTAAAAGHKCKHY